MKRVISLLLCLVLLFGLGDWSALVSAEGTEETPSVTETQETQEETQEEQSTEEETSGEESPEEAPADNGTPSVQNEGTQNTDGTDAQEEETSEVQESEEPETRDSLPILTLTSTADTSIGIMRYLSSLEDSEILTKEIGWGSYGRDVNPDGGKISVMIDGTRTYFTMGVSAHASSTVVYDLGEDHIYDKFSGYFGVDASRGGNGLASLELFGSMDNVTWVSLYKTGEMRGNSNTVLTEVSLHQYEGETDLGRYRYLKLNTYEGANDAADHTVIADAKLYTDNYVRKAETQIQSFDTYDQAVADELAKNNGDYAAMIATEAGRKAVVQRELVTKFGSGTDGYEMLTLNFFSGPKEQQHRDLIAWLMNDTDAAAELLAGGDPDGNVSYKQALMVLSDLYYQYKDDLNDETELYSAGEAGVDASRRRKDVYRTLMFALSLSCASGVYSWQHNSEAEDPLERYAQFKKIYTHTTNHVRYDIFENLNVEEMRWVTGTRIYNEELYWANRYLRAKSTGSNLLYPALYSPHRFLHYGKAWWYEQYGFYDDDNFAGYTETYMLAEDGVQLVNNDKYPHLWMNMTPITSHICWGISYIGTCLAASFGVPSHYALQPGHAVFFVMQRDTATGNITWGIDNNISGWLQTRTGETVGGGYSRMLCDWGTPGKRSVGEWPAPYLLLAQYALDHEEDYEKTTELLSLISTASDNETKEQIYRAVLSIMPYQYDAWYGLVQLYTSTKTTEEIADLAEELAEALTYFPMPMHDLLELLRTACKSDATSLARIVTAEDNALNEALLANSAGSKAPSDMMQKDVCVAKAQQLKGSLTGKLATFSFDGDNAGSIVFGSTYEGVRFQYSLDGGVTWTESGKNTTSKDNMSKLLSTDELQSITSENDIYIWLEGWSTTDGMPDKDKAFVIDISSGITEAEVRKLVEVNDYEDRLLGTLTSLEYSLDDGATWRDLTEDTDLSGALTVKVHKKASGTTLQSADATFTFTDNHTDSARSYIRLSRLTVDSFSTEAASKNQQAVKAIDGLESTIWHTQWGGGDNDRYITLKTDKPTFFSGIDYLPRTDAGNGTITYCEVLVSVDGENWYTAATASWSKNSSAKSITFTDVAYGQYIRIVGKTAAGNFCSAREIRVFENKNFEGKTVAGARLTREPTKLAYAAGEVISFEGAEVQCVYTDGSTHKVPLSMLTVSPEYAVGEGTQEVSLQYLNLPAMTFEIYVTPNSHTASKLSIDVPAAKTSYILDSAPDTSDLVLLATEESTGTVWQVKAEEYQVSPETFTETGTQKVTLTYQGLTAEYEVTVIGKPQSIAVTTAPAKTTYEIGEALAIEDMVVTVTYEDGSTEDLTYSSGRLRVNGEGFSALPGEKTLTVTLTDAASLTARLPITVLTNLIDGEFRYDVEPSDETPPKYTCYLSGYTNTSNTVVSVPASVTCNGITYQVIGVRTGAFATAAQVEVLSLPGTIQTLEEDSLSALTGLERLYLTGISDINNLTIQDGALPEQTEETAGTIYMAGNDMETALTTKLTEYQSTGDGEFHMKQGNLISDGAVESITVTPPAKTVYELEEAYDSTGFTVTAHLTNGIELPLESTLYRMDAVSTSAYGEHTIQVTYTGDETKTGSFTIEVLKTAPTMLANPKDGVYLTGQDISPLSVTVKDGETGTLRYQWYRSSTETLKPGSDTEISGATGSSYTPSDTGYYYVAVWRLDANGAESNPVYSMAAHIQVRDFAIRVEDASGKVTYYAELDEAMAKASSGSTVYLRQDITVTRQTSVVSKTLTVTTAPELSTPATIRRDSSYTGCVLEANNCELTLKNIVLDGGAVWEGTTDAGLGRGTENTGVGETASLLRMQNNTQLTLDTATVQNCAVVSGGGAWGAALYVTSGADVTITGSTFKDNALGSGGCGTIQVDSGNSVITVSGSTFTGNYAPVNGGAFCISAGKLDFQSGTIRLCKAGTGGGGIFLDKNGTLDFHGTVDTCAAPNGGGLYLQNTTTLADGVIQNCSATGDGGGIYVSGASFTFADGTIQNCTATGNGGAICVITGSVTMNGGLIDTCAATTYGGGGIATVSTDNATGSVTVNGGTIQNCTAGYAGGCVYSSSAGILTINGGTFQNSTATNYGGAVATNSISTKNTYINGGTYYGNKANYGGAIFIGGSSTAYVKGGTFRENKATATNGGNIYCAWNGGVHNLSGGLFLYDSGWIYKRNNPTVTITGGTYSTELKSTDGVDTANYEVKTTRLQLRGSSDPITAYTVVKKATEAAADHTELKNATILHSEKASASISVLQNSLQAAATDAGITLQASDITDATTTMALEVTETCTEVNTLGAITRRTFDVTPRATVTYTTTGDSPATHTLTTTVPNDAIHEKVSFQLPVPGTVTATKAMVYHGEDLLGIYPVETGTDSKYITVSSQSFSQFSYILLPETACGDLQIKGAYASVSDNITMHYRVLVPDGYENPYMVFSIYSDVKQGYVETIVTTSTEVTVDTVTYRLFDFAGINPQRMQDTINATLYASKDGVWYKVDKNEYSLKAYLEAILSNSANSKYFTLVSNLIGYGTAAQKYNNYELTQLISDTIAGSGNYKEVDYTGGDFGDVLTLTKVGGGIQFRSAALYLNNEVSVLIKFTLEAGTTIDQVKISAQFADGTKPQEFTEFTEEGDGVYSFLFRNIPATCFSKHILFKSYIGETANDILEYNVNSYLKAYHDKSTKLGVLAKALFNYGCAAKAFEAANPES